MIIKTKINNDTNNLNFLHIILKNYIIQTNYIGNITIDYKNNIRTDINNLIPFLIHKHIIFKYIDTFQQNNKLLANNIRKQVLYLSKDFDNITCIGGESFIYPILLQNSNNNNNNNKYSFYSDSNKLVLEAIYNFNIYFRTNIHNNFKIINYNNDNTNNITFYNNLILNLDCLNTNLLKNINNANNINNIIIINCKPNDFWKKLKLLHKYKLKKRCKFYVLNSIYSQKYFITVNLLQKI